VRGVPAEVLIRDPDEPELVRDAVETVEVRDPAAVELIRGPAETVEVRLAGVVNGSRSVGEVAVWACVAESTVRT
jgi:hypothetical protein